MDGPGPNVSAGETTGTIRHPSTDGGELRRTRTTSESRKERLCRPHRPGATGIFCSVGQLVLSGVDNSGAQASGQLAPAGLGRRKRGDTNVSPTKTPKRPKRWSRPSNLGTQAHYHLKKVQVSGPRS
ncbi:MAG: hypothetical protein A2653_01605 [Candidatus Zambryskibacteria bacterium RIFCSPHIGHO2_01_FULL_43_25]|uniref:Uncharacterized protein n=1 Tax=Candidatus Zambryskibacteria bacterium RIFCSPLOWO2_01_FULL_45_21 TaxID=1802761 RepID=A0A1G2U161_9BACT|nr:MAG: hypothetical protein A2653_01605 [Candidatus Zambryskibacteria bacterium RIFCSPHIGHO2_01_FULL_43_25]OHB00254.1 MAG: hypothetical protein A3E94_00745 [Candidatus Zambryskibacteria bacterium RIFCSPHIGHO2_12_FULL_44_12b]OHB03256.1 MAG: hypothetical protein A3B14_00575 [Candidatus Zambryskibacteria bacterium RIFCSPLOWO2_01_FULL_45_21]